MGEIHDSMKEYVISNLVRGVAIPEGMIQVNGTWYRVDVLETHHNKKIAFECETKVNLKLIEAKAKILKNAVDETNFLFPNNLKLPEHLLELQKKYKFNIKQLPFDVKIFKSKKSYTTIQLPQDCLEKLDAIKAQWGSSHNFQIEMALRAFWKEDLKLIPKRFKCPKCKADIEVK